MKGARTTDPKERIEKSSWAKESGEREGLRSCLAVLRTPSACLPSLAHDRIDRFYFTAPLFSFNSYPGLIAFCRRRRYDVL